MQKSVNKKTQWNASSNKLSLEKQYQDDHYDFINITLSELQNLLILHKMKTGYNGQATTPPLRFNKDWKIVISKDSDASSIKWVREVQGDIEKISVKNVKERLFNLLQDNKGISEEDKQRYIDAIYDFIRRKIANPRSKLEKKVDQNGKEYKTIFDKFRKFYKNYSKEHASKWEEELYKEICLTLANNLYSTNHWFLNPDTGEINEKGLQHLWKIFSKTINYIQSNHDIPFHKIYHDWDSYFLKQKDSQWNPTIWTLNQYVKAIIYLIKKDSFNAYNLKWKSGDNERYKRRKSFLNHLYDIGIMYIDSSDEGMEKEREQKKVMHEKLAKIFTNTTPTPWTIKTERFKSEESTTQKHWWRTPEIKDESWVRVIYYGEWDQKQALDNIMSTIKEYFNKLHNINWLKIKKITLAKKGDFVNDDWVTQIQGLLNNFVEDNSQISVRGQVKKKKNLEAIFEKHKVLNRWKAITPWLQQALAIAIGMVPRGSNWDYKDFKLIVEFEKDKAKEHQTLFQEISFYPETNDLNLWNHRFLELEKMIFDHVKSMDDEDLWAKSISLNRVRLYTEIILKARASDIEKYEEAVQKWLIPQPQNDKYKYLEIDWERFLLEWLWDRTLENTDIFDQIIVHVINYFIKKNKLIYINKQNQNFYGLITVDDLYDEVNYKYGRRFTTPDVLENIACDPKNSKKSISFYTDKRTYKYDNFFNVSLYDLGKVLRLWNWIKKDN